MFEWFVKFHGSGRLYSLTTPIGNLSGQQLTGTYEYIIYVAM